MMCRCIPVYFWRGGTNRQARDPPPNVAITVIIPLAVRLIMSVDKDLINCIAVVQISYHHRWEGGCGWVILACYPGQYQR